MQYNINSCILFSNSSASQRNKTEQPPCIVLLHFLILTATDKTLISKHKLVGTLVPSEEDLQTILLPQQTDQSLLQDLYSRKDYKFPLSSMGCGSSCINQACLVLFIYLFGSV